MNTNYLSYQTKYQFRINRNNRPIIDDVCFGSLFRALNNFNNSGILKIWFASDDRLNKHKKSNYCLLTEKELKFYFSWVKYVTGLNFSYKKVNEIQFGLIDSSGYVVSLRFKNKSAYLIKLFATLIRNVYETPFNIQLKTAMLLGRYVGFKKLDFTSRLMLSIASILDESGRDVHASYRPEYSQKLIKKQKLKYKVFKCNARADISSTFPDYNKLHIRKVIIEKDENIFLSLENSLISQELIEILKKNYKTIKKINE